MSTTARADQVFARMSDPEPSVGLPPGMRPRGPQPIVTFSGNQGGAAEDVDRAVVFINEVADGRSLRVGLAAAQANRVAVAPANPSQPDASNPIVTPPNRKWLVTPHPGNVPDSLLGPQVQWRNPGVVTGGEISFTTSRCGRDRYVVTTWIEGQSVREHLLVEVRKRVSVEHVRVARPAPAAGAAAPSSTHFDMGNALNDMLDYLSRHFAIDHQQPIVTRQVGHATLNMATNAGRAAAQQHVGVPSPAPARTVYVVSAGEVRDRSVGHPQGVAVAGSGGSPPRMCLVSVSSAEQFAAGNRDQELFSVALHEAGHVLGLVPQNPGPDLTVASWLDTHPRHNRPHCNQPSCMMWWEADAHRTGVVRALTPTGIEGAPSSSFGSGLNAQAAQRCWLWLLAADVSS